MQVQVPAPFDSTPRCWACGARATHVNRGFVGALFGNESPVYTCDDHAHDIDDVPIRGAV